MSWNYGMDDLVSVIKLNHLHKPKRRANDNRPTTTDNDDNNRHRFSSF